MKFEAKSDKYWNFGTLKVLTILDSAEREARRKSLAAVQVSRGVRGSEGWEGVRDERE